MPKPISSYRLAEKDEAGLAGDCEAIYKQSLLEEVLVAVVTTAFYGLTLAGLIDCGMRLAAFFKIGSFSAWLFPRIEYPLVAAGLLIAIVPLGVIKDYLRTGMTRFLEEASYALMVELPGERDKIKTLQNDLQTSQELAAQAQQEVTSLTIELRASQLVVEQQQHQLVELEVQLKKLGDAKHDLTSKLEEMKTALNEANKRYEQAQKQARLADLKANEYAARAIEQAVSDLSRTASTLDAMEKQLKREPGANPDSREARQSSTPFSHPSGLKKNYS